MQGQPLGVSAGRPCLLVARFFYRHAHSRKYSLSFPSHDFLPLRLRFHKPPFLRVSATIEVDTLQTNAVEGAKVVKVKFVLQKRCEFGQQFNVIGDDKLLGAWAPEAAIPMQWSEGHIWTSELDLSVGMRAEFKVIRMADQEVLEWLPGPNCKLEVPDDSSSFVVLISWSDEDEASLAMDQSIQEGTDGQAIEERTSNEPIELNVEDLANADHIQVDHIQVEGTSTGDQGVIEVQTRETEALEVLSSFAIPESWYGEESSGALNSGDLIESLPDLVEDVSIGESMLSTSELRSNQETESEEKQNGLGGEIGETIGNSMVLATDSRNIEDQGLAKKLVAHDGPVEAVSERSAENIFLATSNEEESGGTAEVDAWPKLGNEMEHREKVGLVEVNASTGPEGNKEAERDEKLRPAVENASSRSGVKDENQSGEEAVVHNGPSEVGAKVPRTEAMSAEEDLLENLELKQKPSLLANDVKWGRDALSKLWVALTQGRNNEET